MEHLEQKETIYFLEWLSQESGFTENQILENMMPVNQSKEREGKYISVEEFIEFYEKKFWLGNLFHWKESFLKPEYYFWENLDDKWYNIIYSYKYNIEFSRYPIENWRIMKSTKKIKIKSKKLKI